MRQITRKNSAVIAGLAAGLTLLAVADAASAQTAAARSRAPAVTLSEAQAARAATPSQSRLRFTERGRWGLDLNLCQPVGRESHLGDVEYNAGQGFGLGFYVVEDVGERGWPGSAGEFGWGGAYHTTYWVDPRE